MIQQQLICNNTQSDRLLRTFILNSSLSRTATARGKAEQADIAALHARDDGKTAVGCAKEYAGDLVPVTPAITAAEGKKIICSKVKRLILVPIYNRDLPKMFNPDSEAIFLVRVDCELILSQVAEAAFLVTLGTSSLTARNDVHPMYLVPYL